MLPFITLSYSISFSASAAPGLYTLSSELNRPVNQKAFFRSNGVISYVPAKEVVKEINGEEAQSSTFTMATTSLYEVTAPRVTPPAITRIINQQGTVFGAFMESLSPQIAYAGEGGESVAKATKNTSYSFMYILIFLLLATSQVYYKLVFKKAAK